MGHGILRRRAKYGRRCLLLFSSTSSSFCSSAAAADHHERGSSVWKVKEVTKANFAAAVEEVKEHIRNAHYIAVCSQKTGGAFSAGGGSGSGSAAPWYHRVLPVDTLDTAYLKAKHAAEKFELLQFAVCPFRIQGSKLIAFPDTIRNSIEGILFKKMTITDADLPPHRPGRRVDLPTTPCGLFSASSSYNLWSIIADAFPHYKSLNTPYLVF
ncbi:hypothetical protein ACLOJK_023003 [Asimina triloba]